MLCRHNAIKGGCLPFTISGPKIMLANDIFGSLLNNIADMLQRCGSMMICHLVGGSRKTQIHPQPFL